MIIAIYVYLYLCIGLGTTAYLTDEDEKNIGLCILLGILWPAVVTFFIYYKLDTKERK